MNTPNNKARDTRSENPASTTYESQGVGDVHREENRQFVAALNRALAAPNGLKSEPLFEHCQVGAPPAGQPVSISTLLFVAALEKQRRRAENQSDEIAPGDFGSGRGPRSS